jgi:hypothetical protein
MVILPRHATYIYTRVLRCHVRQSCMASADTPVSCIPHP